MASQAYDDDLFKEDPELARLQRTFQNRALRRTLTLWLSRVKEDGATNPILAYSVDKATTVSTSYTSEGITEAIEESLPHYPAEHRARLMRFASLLLGSAYL